MLDLDIWLVAIPYCFAHIALMMRNEGRMKNRGSTHDLPFKLLLSEAPAVRTHARPSREHYFAESSYMSNMQMLYFCHHMGPH